MFRTRDGGATWQGGGPPLEQLPATFPTRAVCGNVTLTDPRHVFLPLTLSEQTDAEKGRGMALVLYATDDGGQTWKVDRSLTAHNYLKNGASVDPFGRVSLLPQADNKVLLMMPVRDFTTRQLTMKTSTREETVATSVDKVLYENEVGGGADFISQTQGWLGTSRGRLLATVDGGATWKDISPVPKAAPPKPTGREFRLKPIGPGSKF